MRICMAHIKMMGEQMLKGCARHVGVPSLMFEEVPEVIEIWNFANEDSSLEEKKKKEVGLFPPRLNHTINPINLQGKS